MVRNFTFYLYIMRTGLANENSWLLFYFIKLNWFPISDFYFFHISVYLSEFEKNTYSIDFLKSKFNPEKPDFSIFS
jgi:hypothetical protein